jgi:hypothetical protein
MNNLPDIEAVEIDVTAAELLKLLNPNNKNGIMFFTKDKKRVFVESSKSKPILVK